MKTNHFRIVLLSLVLLFGLGIFVNQVHAEGETSEETKSPAGISIGIEPTSKTIQLSSESIYDNYIKIKNDSDEDVKVEVYAAPYSYIYSEEEESYKLGYSNQNNFTQISRWISIDDGNGNFVAKPTFTVKANDSLKVTYRIETPKNIPAGGQYAVIFAHALANATTASGIRAEPNIGMIVYGHSTEGEAESKAEISNLQINTSITDGNGTTKNNINAFAKVKNTGNIDFNAYGTLKVEPIIGFSSYETERKVPVSIIPEAELVVKDEWVDTPSFGLYKITWTVTAAKEESQTIERIVFLVSPIYIIVFIIVLTIIIIWIIIRVRRRKERRSRLAV
ncbi:hypothetical protein IKG41_01690 [Candidatus Saccharibacteria bacterium]|nr:hypothetical protein [Candidatus Saccharibacteria bacterium]